MKKLFILILSLAMIVSLCACGGDGTTNSTPTETTTPPTTEPPTVKLNIGETASTDLAEFTLESSQFTYYVSNVSTNYVEPT